MVLASGTLHAEMLRCILRCPMSYFDTTPIGRINNRFSSDVDNTDVNLPTAVRPWISQVYQLLGVFLVISINNPVILAVVLPVGVVYYIVMVRKCIKGHSVGPYID
jgi:ATP-binding cassette subfamily C (CFTR/MRP) protein 1